MKKAGYILSIIWLTTLVMSQALVAYQTFYGDLAAELSSKMAKEVDINDCDDKPDKKSNKPFGNKSFEENEDKYFELKYCQSLSAYFFSEKLLQTIRIANDQYVCTHTIELESPPPELTFYL